jgi:2-polyprenyl-6-methoxyphenol hydroxylase-like FAD-dependent oxidoreductase
MRETRYGHRLYETALRATWGTPSSAQDMTEHSVVLGAGIAGLLAAATLVDAGHRVSIIERNRLPDSLSQRRGVPQGAHLHSLRSRGWHTLEQLVPARIP